jgi:hypothetical protein
MNATHQPNHLSVFLLGAILNVLAAVDFTSLLDYSLKAIAGGLVWLIFKVIGDYLSSKINRSKQDKPP